MNQATFEPGILRSAQNDGACLGNVHVLSFLLSLVVVGCTSKTNPPDAAPAVTPPTQQLLQTGRPEADVPIIRQLDVFVLNVPMGSVSRSDEFWKRVDETAVEPATYKLLLKNGMRVGVAPMSDWSYFKSLIEKNPTKAKQVSISAGGDGSTELPMRQNVIFQNVFYFNDRDICYGRSYTRCDNLLGIGFTPAPRRPGAARLSVCPIVRSLRKRFEVNTRGDEMEIEYRSPEHLYDLNLITDVPPDAFLILAPSDQATWPSSLGNTFLIQNATAEQFERVLLMIPRASRLIEVTPVETSPLNRPDARP